MGGRVIRALMFFLWPVTLCGQQPGPWSVGGSVRATLLVGDASDFLAGDYGAGVHAARRLGPALAARADATYLKLHETAPSGERADNMLLGLGFGPELAVGAGRVDVFLRAFARLIGDFRGGDGGAGPKGTDWTPAFGAAGGLRVHFGRLSVDLAGEVARMGRLGFARVSTFRGTSTEEDLGALSLEIGVGMELRSGR